MDSVDDATHRALEALVGLELTIERYRAVHGRHFSLTPQDLRLLTMICLCGGRAMPRELSLEMHLSSGTLTTMLDRLEASNLVVRRPNPNDRRSVFVELTRSGQRAAEQVCMSMLRALQQATSERGRTGFTRALNELAASFEDEVSEIESA